MFIKSIKINNFKGYAGEDNFIEFSSPNGELGSGLNILVGENNTGKSTIFEAIDFLKEGSKKDPESLLNKSHIPAENLFVELVFHGENMDSIINDHAQANKVKTFTNLFSTGEHGIQQLRVQRKIDITSDPINSGKQVSFWDNKEQEYTNPSGIDAPFKKLYDNNFIWADTNPSDEAKFGASTLCGSLLKEIAVNHSQSEEFQKFSAEFEKIFNDDNSELRSEISLVETKINKLLSEQFGNANVSFKFAPIPIDNLFKTANIIIDDGTSVPMQEKGHGMQRAVALALLQVYAETSSQEAQKSTSKPFFLFIDEPEICMHPKGQIKLLEALLEISKHSQIFITTHSPFIISSSHIKNAGLFIFSKENKVNKIMSADTLNMFPWSPSWAEINYYAYKLPTIELHNELYGFLQSEESNKPGEVVDKSSLQKFDIWLTTKGLKQTKTWIKELKGKPQPSVRVTLQTFIRNHIHHPENSSMKNKPYTHDELKKSIDQMINLLP